MEDLRLYDIDSTELNELIDSKRIELKHKSLEYKKLADKVSEIMENHPNVLALIHSFLLSSAKILSFPYLLSSSVVILDCS